MPFFKNRFSFLRLPDDSRRNKESSIKIFAPSYFTLPIDIVRKRNCYLAARSTLRCIINNQIDFNLIHAHFVEFGCIGVNVKRLYDRPLIITAHGGDVYNLSFKNKWDYSLAKNALNQADAVITVSQSNLERLFSLGISRKKLYLIPNGYDEGLFKPISAIEARRKLGLPINTKMLLSIGNLVDIKGHTHLLDAFEIVNRTRKDVFLAIVGSGPLSEYLHKKTRRLNLESKVFFVGQKSHETIPLWLNACDLFILPSTNEGFPTVIPESLACGRPVIASNVGGIGEILKNREVGMLTPPRDATALSLAILDALDKKWDRETIQKHSQNYSWKLLTSRILSLYDQVLSKYDKK